MLKSSAIPFSILQAAMARALRHGQCVRVRHWSQHKIVQYTTINFQLIIAFPERSVSMVGLS